MQSDIPPLHISCLTNNIRLRRNSNNTAKQYIDQLEKTSKSKPSTSLLSDKKKLSPIIAGSSPYTIITRFIPSDTAKFSNKSAIDQRVSSAKMLRIKQLQNQLADAHFHLNELSNENKLLKAIQKRQDAALKRYEGTKAELPRIINTHQEDYRVLQTKYKKMKSQYKNTSDTLKEKENELHYLQAQNKKLLQLSKDRHLLEREKLQVQVFDLNHRIDQQNEIIQTLKRKLALESKYLKHQLHVEMVKHKETQKQLREAQLKLRSLEELMEQRDKKMYHASHIFFNKDGPNLSSQSLTNLNDGKSENASKTQRRRRYEGTKGQSLPALGGSTSLRRSQSQENPRHSGLEAIATAQTLQLERNAPASHKTSASVSSKSSIKDSPIKESRLEAGIDNVEELKSSINVDGVKQTYELPKVSKDEYGFESDEDQDGDTDKNYDPLGLANRSRLLHTRLVSSAVEGARTIKEPILTRPRSFSRENMEHIEKMNENSAESKYDRDSVVTVISKDMLRNDSEVTYNYSDVESEMEIPIAFTDEEDSEKRKSDIDESEIEKQQKLSADHSSRSSYDRFSTYFSDLHKTKKENGKSDDGKVKFQSINELSVYSDLITKGIDMSIDNMISRKKSMSMSISSDDDYEKIVLEDENFVPNGIAKKDEKINQKNKKLDNYFFDFNDGISYDTKKSAEKSIAELKTGNKGRKGFDKAKLLAAMKAIDDNDNIEFIEEKTRNNNNTSRLQITENLYRGIPTHSKKKE